MIRRIPTRLSHIITRTLQQELTMHQYTPPHKHVGNAGKPGQIINGQLPVTPVNTDMMDEMAGIPASVHPMQPCDSPACVCPHVQQGNTEVCAHAYKPVHGGYPG
jgi:hypothetical protein